MKKLANQKAEEYGIPMEWEYPMNLFSIVDADRWETSEDDMDDDDDHCRNWHKYVGQYISKADDDTVLAIIDYHN